MRQSVNEAAWRALRTNRPNCNPQNTATNRPFPLIAILLHLGAVRVSSSSLGFEVRVVTLQFGLQIRRSLLDFTLAVSQLGFEPFLLFLIMLLLVGQLVEVFTQRPFTSLDLVQRGCCRC